MSVAVVGQCAAVRDGVAAEEVDPAGMIIVPRR